MIRALLLAACLMAVGAAGARAQVTCTIPNLLQNGTIADATQVMTNMNTLVGCITNITLPPVSFTANPSVATAIGSDGFGVASTTNTANPAQAIYNQAVFAGSGTVFKGYDAMRGVATAPSSSTVNTITGVAGYVYNNTVPVGQKSQTAALFGVGVCAINSSNCWGIDTITSDNPTLANTGVTSGTGKFLTNEFDLNITSPNSSGNGLAVGGTALPTNQTLSFQGFSVTKLWGAGGVGTGTSLFANGFIAADACCATGMLLGATALSGTNVASMPLTFNYRDNSGTLQNTTLGSVGGMIFAGGTASFGFSTPNLPNTNAFVVGAQAGSGTNIQSQNVVFNYFDASAAAQSYGMQVNASRILAFTSSVGNSVAKFDFEGGLSVNGNAGATCNSGLGGTSRVVNGLVVTC